MLSKAEWCRYCFHLRNCNLNHFKVVEAVGLKVVASTSSSMASPYKSFKSVSRFKSLGEHTDRHTDTHMQTHW
jgi:hypothetical protein